MTSGNQALQLQGVEAAGKTARGMCTEDKELWCQWSGLNCSAYLKKRKYFNTKIDQSVTLFAICQKLTARYINHVYWWSCFLRCAISYVLVSTNKPRRCTETDLMDELHSFTIKPHVWITLVLCTYVARERPGVGTDGLKGTKAQVSAKCVKQNLNKLCRLQL